MFGIFRKQSEEKLTLERKLEILAACGLNLLSPFTAEDLLQSWPRANFERPGFTMTLVGLGMTEERPPWRKHSVNVWHFDTEYIEDTGSYVRIAQRMAEMTQGSLVLKNVRDQVDLESGVANLDFEHNDKPVHIDFHVNDDWVDPAALSFFVRLLAQSDPSKIFLYHDTHGQDCVIACVTRDQFSALKKAGVNFEPLT
ncbi:MAG TPA: hypothetical protein VK716_05970 [Terracidiphilus sp.]|jgi:hypothetical protein|nr:hypothetical protein [Terracidiphilus sp.]